VDQAVRVVLDGHFHVQRAGAPDAFARCFDELVPRAVQSK
jgi:hypothetical protein